MSTKVQAKKWPDEDGLWVPFGDPTYLCTRWNGLLTDPNGRKMVSAREDADPGNNVVWCSSSKWIMCEVIVPEVEEVPEPPAFVYVGAVSKAGRTAWWYQDRNSPNSRCLWPNNDAYIGQLNRGAHLSELAVIPDERNDPKLVKLIEEAKKEGAT